MADNENTEAQAGAVDTSANADGPKFGVQRIYIKDSSFEAPDSPHSFRKPYNPQVDFSITSSSNVVDEENSIYEVVLKLTATVKQDDKTIFLAEVQQAGVFEIKGFSDPEQMSQLVAVTCPTVLFPYGREALDSMVVKGSFPALMIAPVSFEAIYAQAKQQNADKAAAAAKADS